MFWHHLLTSCPVTRKNVLSIRHCHRVSYQLQLNIYDIYIISSCIGLWPEWCAGTIKQKPLQQDGFTQTSNGHFQHIASAKVHQTEIAILKWNIIWSRDALILVARLPGRHSVHLCGKIWESLLWNILQATLLVPKILHMWTICGLDSKNQWAKCRN